MKVICHSNLDDFRPTVTEMCCRPVLGDMVECILKCEKTMLKICCIRHCQTERTFNGDNYVDPYPYLEIELTKDVYFPK
jgi:hypothetical protein